MLSSKPPSRMMKPSWLPSWRGDIAAGRTPKFAVGLVVVLALLAVLGNWYLPGSILTILINAIGMVLLIVWTFIIISLMRLHPSLERSGSLVIRMPGWPWAAVGRPGGPGRYRRPHAHERRGPGPAGVDGRADTHHRVHLLRATAREPEEVTVPHGFAAEYADGGGLVHDGGHPDDASGVPPSVWDGWACTWQKEASWHADGVADKISEIRSFSH